MNQIKKILKYPIKKTVVIVAVAFAVYVLMSILFIFLSRLQYTLHPNDLHPGRTFSVLFIIQSLVNDFHLLSRLVLELGIITIIAQVIYKFTHK